MGLKITKSIKLGKFLKINKNKKSTSISVGGKDVKVTLNDKKKLTASLPGQAFPTTPISAAKRPARKSKA